MKILIYSLTIFTLNCCASFAQKKYSEKLIGIWNYIETRDKNDNKIFEYEESFGKITANGPKIIFYSDYTFKKIFTPKNIDIGKWKLNKKTMTVAYDLYIDSTDFIGKDLIKKGLALKQNDGKYYEKIEDKIIQFKNDEIIFEERGLFLIYKK